jgi:hypothetical protein
MPVFGWHSPGVPFKEQRYYTDTQVNRWENEALYKVK